MHFFPEERLPCKEISSSEKSCDNKKEPEAEALLGEKHETTGYVFILNL